MPSSGVKAKAAKPIDTMRRRLKLKVKEMKEMGLNDVGKNCFVLSSNQATAFATKHGIKITNRQTAFTVPGTGQYVIIGDRVASKRALADVVRDMHTMTTGLRDVIGSAYKEILRDKKVNVNSRTSIYDLLEDKKKGRYNALRTYENNKDFDIFIENVLKSHMAQFAAGFESLPIIENVDLLRNVIYSGVFTRSGLLRIKENKWRKYDRSVFSVRCIKRCN
jgi:hypothetical protein